MLNAATRRLHVECIDGIQIVCFRDSRVLSEEEVQGVAEELAGLVKGRRGTRLLLNFANVRTMSSGLLAELVKLQRALRAAGGALRLCCLPPEVRPIFSWCRVPFATHDDEQDALDSF